MNIRTLAVTVSAPRDTVFNFLADIENLPRWAGGFCERLYLERGRWRALTSQGELYCELEASAETGLIDLRLGPSIDRMALLPIRVLPLGVRSTLVTVAFAEPPELSAGLALRDGGEMLAELEGLVRRFGGGELHLPEPAVALVEPGRN
ncbi:MAG TPA: hypothetical protein VEB66_12920 [Opitutaceae bacterium]|nr:hypothetical protein [Opitutaceae bacterium]